MNAILFLFALITCVIHQVQCFLVAASTSNPQQMCMLNDVEGCADCLDDGLDHVRSTVLDQNRRKAMTGSTAALLSLPHLHEVFGTLQLNTFGVNGLNKVPEALLQGDFIVRNLWLSRLSYPVLIVCLEIGFFEALKDKALYKDELGKRLDPQLRGNGRALEALVAVMSSLGLLEIQSSSKVALTESARYVLLRNSPYFWGSQLLAADGITSALRRAVHTENEHGTKNYAGHSTEAIESFINSMQAHGAITAEATAEALDSIIGKAAQYPATHILDMAGGSGCFATALSDRYGITVTLADLPTVVDKWQHHHLFSKKINAVPSDLFNAGTWPSNGPDCHFLANVLHDWSKPQVSLILEASYTVLRRNKTSSSPNRLIVVEQLLSDDNSGPLPAALASVSMLLGDWRTGKQYSYLEIEALAKKAGFSKVVMGPKCGNFHTAIIAYV
jgi:O-methyltransferase domain